MTRRVLVGGAIAHHPLGGGGNAWAFLQYVLGLRALGCDVYYVEHIEPRACIDGEWKPAPFAESANARFVRDLGAHFDLDGRVVLLELGGEGYVGMSRSDLREVAAASDLFMNLSGRFHLRDILDASRRRLYLDLDPGFTQIWQQKYGVDMNLAGHDVYVTVGLNIGRVNCPLPEAGVRWQHTLPPVVLSCWQNALPPGTAYTTVADWRGYSPVEWDGVWYGQKAEEFLRIVDLPRRVSPALEICLAIHPDEPDLPRLIESGWHLSDPRVRCATPAAYREYVCGSRGELSAAKNGYVCGRTGWMSDRSACYLAAGRPAIVQDTGLADHLPLGRGLLVFRDSDEAAAALRAVEDDYAGHAAAACQLAEEYLSSDRVLTRLLDLAGA